MKWFPWKWIVRRAARSSGLLDPFTVLARLRQFAEPAEVDAPLDLIRAWTVLQARGIVNSRAIQHNLDWVWPYWVERQFNPRDPSFVPRAFSLSHINLTHRNWTAVSAPDSDHYVLVDPRGLTTPLHDGWSLDAWLVASGESLLPSRCPQAGQTMRCAGELAIETEIATDAGRLSGRAEVARNEQGGPVLHLDWGADGETAGHLCIALRPYNPEGVQFIDRVEWITDGPGWRVNGHTPIWFDRPPIRPGHHHGGTAPGCDRPPGGRAMVQPCAPPGSRRPAIPGPDRTIERRSRRAGRSRSPLRTSSMNIGMFTNAYEPIVGGLEKSIATFVKDLRRLDQRVFVVTLEFAEVEESDETLIRLPALKQIGGTEFSLRLPIPAGLGQRLNTLNPHLIHSHHPFMLGDTALRVARARGLPLVFTHHTLYERYAYRFRQESETLEHIARTIATDYANLCDLVIAPTPSIEQMVRDRGVRTPIEVIPTGVDVDQYAAGNREAFRKRHGLPADAFVAGYLGRVVEAKNVRFLAEAGALLLRRNPAAYFLIVGDGDAQDAVRARFEADGVADRVVMTGSLTGPPVADAYAAMDVFTFASETETQGIVLIESLSAGVPVVALDAPAVRDIIHDREVGRLLPSDTPADALAFVLIELAADPDLRRRFGETARRHAREYDRRHCAQRLLGAYRELQQTKARTIDHSPIDLWTSLQARFATEWDLFKEKLDVITRAISD